MSIEYASGNVKRIVTTRIDDGEELLGSIRGIAEKNNIDSAIVSLIGAVKGAEIITPDPEKARVDRKSRLDKAMEIVGNGNIAKDEKGETVVHLHAAFGERGGKAFAGHVVSSTVYFFVEATIIETDIRMSRKPDENTGFKNLRFEK